MSREIVIDTCVLTAAYRENSQHVMEAIDFIDKLRNDIENCYVCICVDSENRILSEYERHLKDDYGSFLIQRAIEKGKLKILDVDLNHPVCREAVECASELREDIVFIAVTIKTSSKILFTDDTKFFEPCGEEKIQRRGGIPIPITPLRKAGLKIYDLESWEIAFSEK